jgi:hypothetical protein
MSLGISPTVNHVIGDIPHVLLLCIIPCSQSCHWGYPLQSIMLLGISLMCHCSAWGYPLQFNVIGDIPHVLIPSCAIALGYPL